VSSLILEHFGLPGEAATIAFMLNLGARLVRKDIWLAIVWLGLLEVLVFGRSFRSCGFYLDDWTMLYNLHFAPDNFIAQVWYYLLADPRVTLRPLEAPYFAFLYQLFGENSFGYHLVYGLFEVAAMWLFYLLIRDIFKSKALAFVASTLALLDPRHDTTHYWVMCNSVSSSLFFSMLSLWLSNVAVTKKARWASICAWFSFIVSLLNYEVFLPFLFFNALIQARSGKKIIGKLKQFAFFLGIYFLPIFALLAYQKWIVPLLVTPFVHAAVFDIPEMFSTLWDGLVLQLGPSTFAYFYKQLMLNPELLGIKSLLLPLALGISAGAGLFYLMGRRAALSEHPGASEIAGGSSRPLFWAIGMGFLAIFVSYSIFGLNKEYHPAIPTIFNRVNTGAGLGSSLFLAAAVLLLKDWAQSCFHGARDSRGALVALLPSVIVASIFGASVLFSILLCQAFERPWAVSTLTQKNVQNIVRACGSQLHGGDSLLIMNCPRYVNWTPVFDGVWDFERMLQVTLNTKAIKGGVVSERLQFSRQDVRDVSHGYLCGTYAFPKVFLLSPNDRTIFPASNPEQFVDLVEAKGRTFGLAEETIKDWRKSLSAEPSEHQASH
jgi:hypothetical protein